jgi:hypothetical protein
MSAPSPTTPAAMPLKAAPLAAAPMNALRYLPEFEHTEAHEAQATADLEASIEKIQRTVFGDSGHAERGVHAKSHAIVCGELQVLDDLPAVLAQGLFAQPGSYPVVMRFSTIPGDILDDGVSTPRGLAIKLIGVPGERLPGSEADVTQDFVLGNAPAFAKPTAHSFASTLKLLAATTDKAPATKKLLSGVMRGAERIVEAFGGKSATLISLGGQAPTHLLADIYYSQTPLLYGEYMAKIALVPVSAGLTRLADTELNLADGPDALRRAASEFFRAHRGEWELRVQLCTDLAAMPIEDASAVWSEELSPYIAVARIRVPPQQAWSAERATAVDESMSFSPWHGLAAHRPLGSVNRVRRLVYQQAAVFRARSNLTSVSEPRTLDGFPGAPVIGFAGD